MSEGNREIYKEEIDMDEINGFAESETGFYDAESTSDDEEFKERMEKRRARVRRSKRKRKIVGIIIIVIAFATLATMCGRDIVRLKAENINLLRQQRELEEERDKLREEVKNSGKREYVQEQAKKQLRLLNPGELLFTFEDEDK